MRIYCILTVILCLTAIAAPFISCSMNNSKTEATPEAASEEKYEAAEEKLCFINNDNGEVEKIEASKYIIGVVSAEMPASFSVEALKAQAVAAYTYYKYINENNITITDSSSLHQSYIDTEEQKNKWGDNYKLYRNKIEEAVKAVSGEYLTYKEKTAMTVFHAASSGKTNSAEEIWGSSVPYLISKESPSEENFTAETIFTAEKFRNLFKETVSLELKDDNIKRWASVSSKSEDGFIRTLKVADTEFTALEIKDILSLPSVNFTAKLENNTFVFTTEGKGHGVGMSQYSAEYMALKGKSYKEILSHFYPGTTLEKE